MEAKQVVSSATKARSILTARSIRQRKSVDEQRFVFVKGWKGIMVRLLHVAARNGSLLARDSKDVLPPTSSTTTN